MGRVATEQDRIKVEYIHPTVFDEYSKIGEDLGFAFVASGPFIRSSYNAIEFSKKVMAERLEKAETVPLR